MSAQAIILFSLASFEVANAAANRVRIADVAPIEFGRPSINVARDLSLIDDIEKTIMQDEDKNLFRTLFMGSMSLSYDVSENGEDGAEDTEGGGDDSDRTGTGEPALDTEKPSAATTTAAAATSGQTGSATATATAAASGKTGETSSQPGADGDGKTVGYTGEESDTGGSTGEESTGGESQSDTSGGSVGDGSGAGSGAATTGSETGTSDTGPQQSAPAPDGEGDTAEKAAINDNNEDTPLSGSSEGGGNMPVIIGATVGTAVMAILAFAVHKRRSARQASGASAKDIDTLASEPPTLDESWQHAGENEV